MALERKALDMKEQREKKLMEEKFRVMQEMVSIDGGSSTESKTTFRSQKSNSKETIRSELVSSWIEDQNKIKHHPHPNPIHEETEQMSSYDVFGVNVSIPVDEWELSQINRNRNVKSEGLRNQQFAKSAKLNDKR